MRKSKKGSSFERDFAVKLSIWFSKGTRSDLFWRTAGSGARATTRAKKGQKTANSIADICAIDEAGKPFTDLFTIELKRGYNKFTIQDWLDKPKNGAEQLYEGWIKDLVKKSKENNTPYWMLVVKRDRRETLVFSNCKYCNGFDIKAYFTSFPFEMYCIKLEDLFSYTPEFFITTNKILVS